MGRKTDIWTYLIITAVSILVWGWAANETRIERPLRNRLLVTFSVADPDWQIAPGETSVSITAAGSQRAIGKAEELKRLSLDLPPSAGTVVLDLLDALRSHPDIRDTGISILSADPNTVGITLDEIVRVPARVRAVLPLVQTVDEVEVSPAEVTVSLPGRLRPLLPEDLTVEAFLNRRDLDHLERGVPHRIEHVPLRLPDQLSDGSIRISPTRVTLGFTIRSKMRELRLGQPVRVQLAGPHEDTEYLVAFDPKQLRDVEISAPLDLIERIKSGEGVVVAFVHLKSTEKEARRDRKPVTFFLAIFHNTDEGIPVIARVGENGDEHPMIGVTITERNE